MSLSAFSRSCCTQPSAKTGRRMETSASFMACPRRRAPAGAALADYLVISAPLTLGTRGLIGEPELHAMKAGAVLINIGRGPVVYEAALVRALQTRRIRGAALDVFDTEPLPAGHPFYGLDNVLLSPHSADHFPGWQERAMQLFLENFERFPFTGLTLLCLKNETRDQVEADLRHLMEAPDVDASEIERRKGLLQLYQNGGAREPIEFTSYSMKRRR